MLQGAFALLEALTGHAEGMDIAELSATTNIPRTTVARLLKQLHEQRSVARDGTRWITSHSMLHLVQPLITKTQEVEEPWLRLLREQTGATVSLVVMEEDHLVVRCAIRGRDSLPADIHAGVLMPDSSAAAIALDARATSPRRRAGGAAIDDEHSLPGLTCFAVPVALGGVRRAALQIATAGEPVDRYAAAVQLVRAKLQQGDR